MELNPGARLGPYEIVSPLGAGGMGEVWRARDGRLDREVAIKLLPDIFAGDGNRLHRFEREARAAGRLNHPNLLAVYDVGVQDGTPYMVSELLEGETLRQRLGEGVRLPARKAIEIGIQVANGLAAAHGQGIVHRDLKPDNVVITRDGRAKIIDFGLAKLSGAEAEEASGPATRTVSAATDAGVILGTVGYMSPEQVRGQQADHRSDIFSLGAILYEMLSGRRAFHGDSAVETMNAILKEEPADLPQGEMTASPGLQRVVWHCLEKSPEARFQSARDIAFDLESLSGLSTPAARRRPSTRGGGRALRWVGAAALLLVVAVASGLAGRRLERRDPPAAATFQPLSYRQEPIFNARFSADGTTVLYSAAPEGNSPRIFAVRPGTPGATSLGPGGTHILAVSSQGELAVLTRARFVAHSFFQGTLARMSLDGGAPREILDGVREADWSPDGRELAIVRSLDGADRLEYPAGKVLYRSGGYVSNPRFSPRGDRIAFFEHPYRWDDRGLVAVVDMAGRRTVLSEGYWGEEGLAWSRSGEEVLFSAGTAYNNFKVFAVDLAGHRREALASAGGLTIQDVGRDGRWLVTRDDFIQGMPVMTPGQPGERDLSWLDLSYPAALSPDGRSILFSEESGSLGLNYAVCLRQTDGSPVVRLGEGAGEDLSRDGKWALALVPTTPPRLVIYPTGPGEPRPLPRGSIAGYDSAAFFPDSSRVLACGYEEGRAERCFVQAVAGGDPRPATPEGTGQGVVAPDGRSILVKRSAGGWGLVGVDGGELHPVPGTTQDDSVVRWDPDGRSLLLYAATGIPARVERLDLRTGERTAVRTFGPQELAGVLRIDPIRLSDDGRSYTYGTDMMISHLFLVDGAH